MKVKSYTDLEESKKLAEILPPESADMHYSLDIDIMEHESVPTVTEEDDHFELFQSDIPCWSLSALLSVLPQTVRLVGTSKDSYWYCECVNTNNQEYAGFGSADNPVDACYEMIVKLHELNLLEL